MPRKPAQQPPRDTILERSGLFHDADALPGTEAFILYRRNGARLGNWVTAEGETDTQLIEAFLDFLDRKEPQLRLVPSSSRRPA